MPLGPANSHEAALGAAFGLSIISSFEVHDRKGDVWSHPDSLKRLSRFLDKPCAGNAWAEGRAYRLGLVGSPDHSCLALAEHRQEASGEEIC